MSDKKITLIEDDESTADLLKTMVKTLEANGLETMGIIPNCSACREIFRNNER